MPSIFFHRSALYLAAIGLLASFPGILIQTVAADAPIVQINPRINYGLWEGWGTSLCWDGKSFGDRDDFADLLFTTKTVSIMGHDLPGLGLTIVRYNAGACSWNAVDGRTMVVSSIIKPFRQMEGFWLDGKSDDPQSSSWNWKVDPNQRRWLLQARDRGANRFELFSNSPMWWMCRNSNPSGADSAQEDNLAPENYEKFATYLATIARYAKDNWRLGFTSIEPFNEPTAAYWFANCKQEGCHFSREAQAAFLPILRRKLDALGLQDLPIAASDETAYDSASTTWSSFNPTIKGLVAKVNVHGYQMTRGNRDALYQIVSSDHKELWNSEYGEGNGSGLKLAECLNLDLNKLHPTAWCYWQPVGGGWGFLRADDSTKILQGINIKFFVVAQYTRHIRPGMTILQTSDVDTVAAYDAKMHKLVLIVRGDKAETKLFDLSQFGSCTGPITTWITEPKGTARYEIHHDAILSGKRLSLTLPADSVQTAEIENVSMP
jgi:galactan endo-1,6-beta-galactosidase